MNSQYKHNCILQMKPAMCFG